MVSGACAAFTSFEPDLTREFDFAMVAECYNVDRRGRKFRDKFRRSGRTLFRETAGLDGVTAVLGINISSFGQSARGQAEIAFDDAVSNCNVGARWNSPSPMTRYAPDRVCRLAPNGDGACAQHARYLACCVASLLQ